MIFVIKILLISALGIIVYQDIKDHMIWWFLPVVFGFCGAYLFYKSALADVFVYTAVLNLVFIIGVGAVLWLLAILKKDKSYYKNILGLGDVLMIIAFAISFSFFQFINLFLGAIVFSWVLHFLFGQNRREVPLAGYMSIFLIVIFLGSWVYDESILYI